MSYLDNYNNLNTYLKKLNKICIAYSGGVDSTMLLKASKEVLGENVLAITVKSSMCPEKEIQKTTEFTKKIGVKHIIIEANEYEIDEFVQNGEQRCYYCKKSIFTQIKKIAQDNGFDHVADGSNVDDDSDYRPGMRAIKELEVLSPLKANNFTKEQIRLISKDLDLYTWNKPSMACLASRIPYGKIITKEKLKKVELAEDYLLEQGFSQFRVRYFDETAKIEVIENEIMKLIEFKQDIITEFKKIGFLYVTMDLQGYRTGSMNETLDI